MKKIKLVGSIAALTMTIGLLLAAPVSNAQDWHGHDQGGNGDHQMNHDHGDWHGQDRDHGHMPWHGGSMGSNSPNWHHGGGYVRHSYAWWRAQPWEWRHDHPYQRRSGLNIWLRL
jgi:hypothetical protein